MQTLQHDMQRMYQSKAGKGKRPWELPVMKVGMTEGTVFHQRFLTVTVNEMHEMCNIGVKYYAALHIFQQAEVKLGLTATPLLTSPKAWDFITSCRLKLTFYPGHLVNGSASWGTPLPHGGFFRRRKGGCSGSIEGQENG
jgi:hypothetical protein